MERLAFEEKGPKALKILSETVKSLGNGGVIIYPTDTLYGFGVNAADEEALERLYAIKKRDPKKAPLVVVSDIEMAREYVTFTPEAKRLADTFLPGPLTLVLPRNPDAPERFLPGSKTIGIRIPNNTFCLNLVRRFGKPITSTSVNISGEDALTDPDDIETIFGRDADIFIDAGTINNSPSTIVDFSGEIPTVLREGALSVAVLNL